MILEETTQLSLNGEEVGCANIATRTYSGADGVEREGVTAQLSLASTGTWVVVGEGSEFQAGGKTWRVLSVTEGDPGGSVEIAAAE